MLNFIKKDLMTVEKGIVVHGVNCQHKMALGIARQVRKKWPSVYDKYMEMPRGKSMLGTAHIINVSSDNTLFVANLYSQIYYGRDGKRYASPEAIGQGLEYVLGFGKIYDLPVYMPKIGCSLGGLSWADDVKPIIDRLAEKHNQVDLFICEV